MTMLTQGLNKVRDLVAADITTGGIGINATSVATSDTGLFGAGTTLNDCEASTGWAGTGDGSTPVVNSVAGEYAEGTSCLNMPYTASANSALYTCDLATTTDQATNKVVGWFYIDNQEDLESGNAVKVYLGTAGLTNANIWNFDKDDLGNGWNSLVVSVDSPDTSTGTGATDATIDTVGIYVAASVTQASNDMRTDYWRYYEPDQLGVTDSLSALTITSSTDKLIKTKHIIPFTESNGLAIVEAGDNNGTTVYNRYTFTEIYKDENRELRIDKYYYIQGD